MRRDGEDADRIGDGCLSVYSGLTNSSAANRIISETLSSELKVIVSVMFYTHIQGLTISLHR